MQAKRLSYYPFDSISLHGPFDLPVHTDPNPALAEVVVEYDQGKAFAVQTFALFVHLFKLPPLAQQRTFGKTFTGQRLSRKSFTAFRPSRR